jgi:hypothetical protein
MCVFKNGFSSVYDIKNYTFATSFSAVLKYQPGDFPELVPPLVPHSRPSYHMLGHLSWSLLQTSFPIIFNSTFYMLHSHCTFNTLFYQLELNVNGESVSPLKTNPTVNFPVGHILHCCCLCMPMYSIKCIWFTHFLSSVPSVACYPLL